MKKITIGVYILIFIIFSINISFGHLNIKSSILNTAPSSSIKQNSEIFIDLEDNRIYLFKNKILQKSYPVATGQIIYPSPIGIWKIVNKEKWGEGFGGSWMQLNVPWGKYGIHGTEAEWSIGSCASHGCIRMYNENASELYDLTPIGTTVVISNGPYGAFYKSQREIIPGDVGADVLEVQKALKKLGFYKGSLDGKYGDVLKESLFKFQESKKVEPHNEIRRYDLKLMGLFQFE